MPFIGQNPSVGAYNVLDNITISSSTNTFSMLLNGAPFSPQSANHLLVSLNGVIQKPGSSFTVNGDQITFIPASGTLTTSDTIDFIMVLGNVLDIGTPSDGSVSSVKLATGAALANIGTGAITGTKLADNTVNLAKINQDFYKTGTFSVLFRDGSGNSGNDSQTFSGQTYVKIGSVVHCNIFCENITTTGMGISNDMYMHGLPFAPNRTSYAHVWTSHVTFTGGAESISFVATNGVTYGYFSALKSSLEAETLDSYHFGSSNNNADIGMHLTYFTDS